MATYGVSTYGVDIYGILMFVPAPQMPPPSVADVTWGPGLADVLISTIGGRNSIPIQAADLGVTWEVNRTSQMSADLPLSTVLENWTDPRSLEGQWISWTGHPAGDWGGVITSASPSRAQGVVTCACSDWSYYLAKRNLQKSVRTISGLPGGVAAALLTQALAIDTLWLNSITTYEEGDFTAVQINGQVLLDAMTRMAFDTDQEFDISASRDFTWARRLGRDRTNSVQLNEGMEIAESSPVFDIADIVNDLTISPAVSRYQDSNARDVVDSASVIAIGRQQGQITTHDSVRPAAIRAIGAQEVARSAKRGATIALDVVDVNNCFAEFREGDTIRVVIASLGLAEDVRILQRGLVLSQSVLHVTGEIA